MASSSNEPNLLGNRNQEDDDLETEPILKKQKEQSEEEKDTTKGFVGSLQGRVELLETINKSFSCVLLRVAIVFVLTHLAVKFRKLPPEKRLSLFPISLPKLKILDIIRFFKCNHVEEALLSLLLRKKQRRRCKRRTVNIWKIVRLFLMVAKIAPNPTPQYCIDHKVWYNLAEKLWHEDYLRQESLTIEEDDLETNVNMKKMKVYGVYKK
ncbi:unnamed protein product [Arabis nemorensis]|uniref:Uncharacterized protein n=1 Tax=Arabis nemorensis TaxID=586526 RepID=A0A565CBK1_9BRAS|nr:unnamed protein product [Arabis nemorensis]